MPLSDKEKKLLEETLGHDIVEEAFGQVDSIITIDKQQAAQGIEQDVIIRGKQLRVKIPAGIKSGTKIRLRGARLAVDNIPGNLLIQVKVVRGLKTTDRPTKMNWFKKHLNWTFVSGLTVSWIVGCLPLLIYIILQPDTTNEIISNILGYLVLVVVISVRFILGSWVLNNKGRNLWWLLILLIPFGEITILMLKNELQLATYHAKLEKMNVSTPSSESKIWKMKIVIGVLVVVVIALVGVFVPIMTVSEPLSYQTTKLVKKEQLDPELRSAILSTVAFSTNQNAISKALMQANQQFLVIYISVRNTDIASGIFNVHIVFLTPTGDQYKDAKDITLSLKPGELQEAKYGVSDIMDADKGQLYDIDKLSYDYKVIPTIKYIKVPIFNWVLSKQ